MQETVPQPPRTQYSILDLLVVVLIFGSHMALMTQHYLAGVDYALMYTCFALGLTLVFFILSQKKLDVARAHRPAAFFACAFLVFGFFHWVAPSTSANSTVGTFLSNYKLSAILPPGSTVQGYGSGSGQGTYSAEYHASQQFISKKPLRNALLNRVTVDLTVKMNEKGIEVANYGNSFSGSDNEWEESRSFTYSTSGWRGHLKVIVKSGAATKEGYPGTISIQAIEIRR
jgi:hypothetical protein